MFGHRTDSPEPPRLCGGAPAHPDSTCAPGLARTSSIDHGPRDANGKVLRGDSPISVSNSVNTVYPITPTSKNEAGNEAADSAGANCVNTVYKIGASSNERGLPLRWGLAFASLGELAPASSTGYGPRDANGRDNRINHPCSTWCGELTPASSTGYGPRDANGGDFSFSAGNSPRNTPHWPHTPDRANKANKTYKSHTPYMPYRPHTPDRANKANKTYKSHTPYMPYGTHKADRPFRAGLETLIISHKSSNKT